MKDKLRMLEIEQQHLKIVSDFAVGMLSLSTTENILWYLAREVVAKMGFDDVVIYMMDEQGELRQAAAFGNKNPTEENITNPLQISVGSGVVGNAALSKLPLRIDDTREYPGYIIDDEIRLSEIAVPMIAGGRVLGVIDSEHWDTGFYTEQHQRTLVAIASIAATKMVETESVLKLQLSIEQLEYSSKIQDTLFEIAELIFQTECITDFYQRLHTCLGRLIYANNFYVALTSEGGEFISFPYFVDEEDKFEEDEMIPLKLRIPGITEHVLITDKPMLAYESDLKKLADDGVIDIRGSYPKAWLGVPFGSKELKGVVVVQSYCDTTIFNEKDKQLLVFAAKHIRNAIERMKAKSSLKFLALHDPLTQLPNRLLFSDRIEHAIDNARCKDQPGMAVLFLDLDRFKLVNDTYGHLIGDKLLVEVSNKIGSCIREFDTLSRFGGDEFAILLENVANPAEVTQIGNRIIDAVQQPVLLDEFHITTSTSIGVTFYRGEGASADELLQQADEAMYQAKLHGRNQLWHFDSETEGGSTGTYKVERDFVEAVENQDLFLQFQPLINMASGKIIGAEALIRWDHHDQGIIQPNAFIPELEKAGYIYQLDLYVVAKGLEFLSNWQNSLPKHFRLSINVSGVGFNSLPLLETLKKAAVISPEILHHLCIEIVEQSIVNSVSQTQDRMKLLARMGVQVALDDFGTGYSSLSYLHKFSFDYIKIDRSFIQNQQHDKDNGIILETMINLAKSLNIRTTAEGIETHDQYMRVQQMQCSIGQGFYMSKPIDEQDLLSLIQNKTRPWAQ
ncbi:MAG: diguanylate cyclase (GGDEF)-like protein [Phenylobacterium sp.]|jgi:diguanylate cyclase (GGDEF)-like protein